MQTLLKYRKNPFVRACGALYVRFLSPFEQLWERLSPYLLDDQEFKHTADKSRDSITFGAFCQLILEDKNFFNIILPRVPILINREILKHILPINDKRKRKQENQAKSSHFRKGMLVFALSKREDGQWRRAKVLGIHYQAMYPIAKKT